MQKNVVLGALIGLAGAVENSGKTMDTDRVVLDALCDMENEAAAEGVREEKYRISPGCRTCSSPCGNTSDFDFADTSGKEKTEKLKAELLAKLCLFAADRKKKGRSDLPDTVYRALVYIKYDLEENAYVGLIEEIEKEF